MNAPGIQGPPQRILLATDLTARCDRALSRATALAETWSASLVAVHALEQPDGVRVSELERSLPTWRRTPDLSYGIREIMKRDIIDAAPDVTAIVERGRPIEVISRIAQAQKCDLIVTGISRDETLTRLGLRRTIDGLTKKLDVPLLVVKQKARVPYRHILVAADLSDASRRALQTTAAFFPTQPLDIFHAYELRRPAVEAISLQRQEEYHAVAMKDCVSFVAASGIPEGSRCNFRLVAENGPPGDLIHEYVRDHDVDLVVLSTNSRNAVFKMLFGSTTRDVLASSHCDVLIVRSLQIGH